MNDAADSSQTGIPERAELLHLIQLYEFGVIHSMPEAT